MEVLGSFSAIQTEIAPLQPMCVCTYLGILICENGLLGFFLCNAERKSLLLPMCVCVCAYIHIIYIHVYIYICIHGNMPYLYKLMCVKSVCKGFFDSPAKYSAIRAKY
jgi:hypothetical protein